MARAIEAGYSMSMVRWAGNNRVRSTTGRVYPSRTDPGAVWLLAAAGFCR